MLQIDVITLFPEYFSGVLAASILGRAIKNEYARVAVHDLRQYGVGKHQLTDDRPYGGGAGMVLMIEPIAAALEELGYTKGTPHELIVLTSAKGEMFVQPTAQRWSELSRLCIICGHYEGVDERVAQHLVDQEIRIGDYVLTGGEPAAAVVIDTTTRLIPGVLGNEESLVGESHSEPGKRGPQQYTKPLKYQEWEVPPILLTGHHQRIAEFRELSVNDET